MKVTNKYLTKTKQRNVIVNNSYYTQDELMGLYNSRMIFTIEKDIDTYNMNNHIFRISLDDISEINVQYDSDYDTLVTVARVRATDIEIFCNI